MAEWDSSRAVPKPEGKKKRGGTSPRKAGDRVEKKIADALGEQRNVGSGAFKASNKNLTGDIDIRAAGRDYIKMEVKMTGQKNAAGDKVFSIKEQVVKQAIDEAHAAGELAAIAIHYKNGITLVAMPFDDWAKMLDDAKLGAEIRRR